MKVKHLFKCVKSNNFEQRRKRKTRYKTPEIKKHAQLQIPVAKNQVNIVKNLLFQ